MSDEYVGWGGVTPYTPYAPSPESNKRRAARARKQKSNNAAERKAAALARKQQAAERKAARKLIAQQKKEQRLAKRAATRKRIEEHKRLVAAKKAERQRQAEERRLAIEQKRAIALEHKLAREKARREEKARRAADKALAELRKKTMGAGDCEPRVGIAEINNNFPYVEDEAATSVWGVPDGLGGFVPLESEVVFDDIDNPEVLLSLGKERLEKLSKPQVSYEADVVSLGRAGFSSDAVGVGDVVQIVDTTFNPPIRVEGRVLKIEEDLLETVDATRITLGTIQETYTQRRASQQQKLDELIAKSSDWNTAADCENVYIHDLINRMNDILNARGGYTYLTPDEGIVIYDKPEDENPTKAIQLGGGFWRVADSLKPNGDWDWKNLADGSGIYANRIYTGILSDAVGKNFWNLDTGEFSLQSSAKIGGKTVQQIVDDSADGVISKMNESLTQEAIFNKLTNNGETQGIYLSGGHVYLNASYLRTGTIAGARGKWDLDSGVISMWDKNGYETVHLDGDGEKNLLIGTFRTSRPGTAGVVLSPDFTTINSSEYSSYSGFGSGIEFEAPGHSNNPLIASQVASSGGMESALWASSGRVNDNDPRALMSLEENRKNGSYYANARLTTYYSNGDPCGGIVTSMNPMFTSIFSNSGGIACGIDIQGGDHKISFNGALNKYSQDATFYGAHEYFSSGLGARAGYTAEIKVPYPARYGRYYAVASSDTDWGQVNCHVARTGNSDGWSVGMENNVNTAFDWPIYVTTFGWLTK